MSFVLISSDTRTACKDHECIWCDEKIRTNQLYVRETSTYCGEFQDHRWHPECKVASEEWFSIELEPEFEPGVFKRGTIQFNAGYTGEDVDMSETKVCERCKGHGKDNEDCETCDGNGWVVDPDDGGTMTCPDCGNEDCPHCDGTGEVEANDELL